MQQAAQWEFMGDFNNLPSIDDIAPITSEDMECFREIRKILKRHDRLDRFGIALLHRHFDLREGEILVEMTDPIAREQTITPCVEETLPKETLFPTILSLKSEEGVLGCYQSCVWNSNGHRVAHVYAGS
jgi:hypothetical protein